MGTEQYPLWDLRIDDADDPLSRLHKEKSTFDHQLIPTINMLPTRIDPRGGFNYESTADAV